MIVPEAKPNAVEAAGETDAVAHVHVESTLLAVGNERSVYFMLARTRTRARSGQRIIAQVEAFTYVITKVENKATVCPTTGQNFQHTEDAVASSL